MQTHFDGGSIGLDLCRELKEKGVEHFRMDGQHCSFVDCLAKLNDAIEIGVDHLIILNDLEMLASLENKNVEWMNEPNGRIDVEDYYSSFMKAYEVCQIRGHKLHGPCISNTNQKSIDWLNEFMDKGVPEDIIVTYHTYRSSINFNEPHRGFSARGEPGEMKWILAAAAGRSIACSEVGYNSTDENAVALNMVKEFELAKEYNCLFCTYFQLNDDTKANIPMGARRPDGTWKPVMDSFSKKND